MRATLVFSLTSSLLAASLFITRSADACGAPGCVDTDVLPPTGATIPAGTRALAVSRGGFFNAPEAGADVVTLLDVTGGGSKSVAFTIDATSALLPAIPLEQGHSYELHATSSCEATAKVTSFRIGPAASLPTKLGVLSANALTVGMIAIGSSPACSAEVAAGYVDVHVTLDAEAEPWTDLLEWSADVDGLVWAYSPGQIGGDLAPARWGSSIGRGSERLYTVCGDAGSPGASRGLTGLTHSVVLRATLPGTNVELATDPITVVVACTGPWPDGDGGGGTYGGPYGDGVDGPTPIADVPTSKASGCSTAPGTRGGAWALGGAAMAFALVAARRRARSMR